MIPKRPSLADAPPFRFDAPGAARLDGLHGFSPAVHECWNHLGDSLFRQRRLREALACYAAAAVRGGDPAARGDRRWMAWMMLGQLERAWQVSDELERLHRARGGVASCHMWDGSPPDGRDVFVRCCHGLGDTLQFIRYLPLLRPRCRSLILQAQRELWPVLKHLKGIDELVPSWEALPEGLKFDLEVEVMELPYLFRSSLATLPRRVPYLHVAPAQVEAIRHRLETLGARASSPASAPAGNVASGIRNAECGGVSSKNHNGNENEDENEGDHVKVLNIGLAWASSRWNPTRSVPLTLFNEAASLPGVRFFSLQWGDESEELLAHPELPIINLSASVKSIENTAAAILALDLVISPDTMLAHLAGALGRPVWVVLLHQADWRWMASGERSPWYPTMRLFRQARPGDWASAVARLTETLRQETAAPTPPPSASPRR